MRKTRIPIGKTEIENTGDTKGHEGPRYRQETIDANRTGGTAEVVGSRYDDGGRGEVGEGEGRVSGY